MRFETILARGGRDIASANRPLTPPIYQTNVYAFETMEDVEAVWEGKTPGFVYGRYGSPNTAMLEAMVAALEGGEAAVATASGMGALTALFLALVGLSARLGPIYWAGLAALSLILFWEHRLVKPDDFSRVNKAFFDFNAYVSVGYFLTTLGDLLYAGLRNAP